ncbi:amino acid ABC transporter permease [Streptomyces sp. TRM66268-LWL]|uniref:Amino acid ABC transporter permease n=1 Tax=Streptomyces polyasparticus TaxID=2767826 RepID=A0ABR7SSL1_9ACTN|nr:amino acid ABC transporter permease [Streptomyces polyasparticus]MBC9718383.1 amino acid ABC transporter permease [Streptomyces polyasparticus]
MSLVPSVSGTPAAMPTAPDVPHEQLRTVPMRHRGRWAAAAVALVAGGGTLWSLAKNPNLDWPTVGAYLFHETVFSGLVTTLWLTAAAMAIGLAGGTVVAVLRLSANPVLSTLAGLFVWFFRSTPILVQIIFWGFLGALYPNLMLGIPFTDITFYSASTSAVITPTVAALLALGLNEVAYAAEIIRGGIQSIDPGQAEAAHSLGMKPGLTLRRVVLPQAMRVIVPPMGNETVTMLKTTALVSVIAGHDLMSNIQDVYAQNYKVIPLLVVAALWYLLLVSLLSVPQGWLERRYGRGSASAAGPSALRRLLTVRAARPGGPRTHTRIRKGNKA